MPFSDQTLARLAENIDPDLVSVNPDGFLYIEGYLVFQQANEIFGYGNWSGRILSITSERDDANKLIYFADTEVIVRTAEGEVIVRQDTGAQPVASGPGKLTTKAMDSARKAAVTDAYKRTFRSFGAQFGNSLYDKDSAENEAMKRKPAGRPVQAVRSAPVSRPALAAPGTVDCEGLVGQPCAKLEPAFGKLSGFFSQSRKKSLTPEEHVALSKERFGGRALCTSCMKLAASAESEPATPRTEAA